MPALRQGLWCVRGVALLLIAQYVLYGAKDLLVGPFAWRNAVAWAFGWFPLVVLLMMLRSGNLLVYWALVIGHAVIVLMVVVCAMFLFLVPARLQPHEQTKVMILFALGALSAGVCVLLLLPGTRALLEERRKPLTLPLAPPTLPPPKAPPVP